YMTGGIAVILGEVGRNFGAGMSGGIAYVYDTASTLSRKANAEGLNFLKVEEDQDKKELRQLVENHYNATLSPLAQRLLENWDTEIKNFTKVLPEEYRKALIRLEEEKTLAN
ncbi:MAG: hypothetical protein OSB51_05940, partial [Dokdonia donghaensis]|nr:hypothetical protein [Dokdonia donghaensis]